MNKVIVGASAGAIFAGVCSIIANKISSQSVNWKRAYIFSFAGGCIGGAGAYCVSSKVINDSSSKVVKDVPIKSIAQPNPNDFKRCSVIAKRYDVSSQKVVAAAKKVGVYNKPGLSMSLGGAYRADKFTYLSDSYGYSEEAIKLMESHLVK